MSTKIGRNDPCWCGSGKKYKTCHAAFDMKLEKLAEAHHKIPSHSIIKTPDQIAGIKESAQDKCRCARLHRRAYPRGNEHSRD